MPLYYPDSLQHNNPNLKLIAEKWIDYEVETVNRTIYISTTGNDITGDGTALLPYLTPTKALSTIKRYINPSVTVTIHFGIGTFTMTVADFNTISKFQGSGTLTFEGEMILVDSGFTMGASLTLDPLTYNVSGGNTSLWTLNQWKHYFLKNGTSYYPITHNALTPTLSLVADKTGTEIYQAQTIINVTASSNITLSYDLNSLVFSKISLSLPAYNISFRSSNNVITFSECYILGQSKNFSFLKGARWIITQTSTRLLNLFFQEQQGGPPIYNYIYATSAYLVSIQNLPMTINSFTWWVFEHTGTSGNIACLYYASGATISSTVSTHYIKFVNSWVAIRIASYATIDFSFSSQRTILVNTSYLIAKFSTSSDYAAGNINIPFANILGTPVVRWFYDQIYEFINLTSGRLLKFQGLIYPEFEQNLTATLTNNATTNMIIGNKLQNKSISIDYTIKRGTGIRQGKISIINDGTNLFLSPDVFNDNGVVEVGDPAIVFTANYNTNEIRLATTLNNSGNAGTMQYDAVRKMNVPLTI